MFANTHALLDAGRKMRTVLLVGIAVFGSMTLATGCDFGSDSDDEYEDDDDDDDDDIVGDDDDDNVPKSYDCQGEFCDDLVTFCEWTVPAGCNGYDGDTVQQCIDGVQLSFPYCGYPENLASCMADCVTDYGDPTCGEYDGCFEDHECSWFGDCE